MRAPLFAALVSLASVSGCGDGAPRMQTDASVLAGDGLVVHFDAPVASRPPDARWLTLAPAGSPDSFIGDRTILDDGALDAAVLAPSPGDYEVRLHDEFPTRAFHVIARLRVRVAAPPIADDAPPVWYW